MNGNILCIFLLHTLCFIAVFTVHLHALVLLKNTVSCLVFGDKVCFLIEGYLLKYKVSICDRQYTQTFMYLCMCTSVMEENMKVISNANCTKFIRTLIGCHWEELFQLDN